MSLCHFTVGPNPEHNSWVSWDFWKFCSETESVHRLLQTINTSLTLNIFICASDVKPHPPSLLECSWVFRLIGGHLHLKCKIWSFISIYPVRFRSKHCTHSNQISPRIVFIFMPNNFSILTPSTIAIYAELSKVVWTSYVLSYCCALVPAVTYHKYPYLSQCISLISPSGVTSSREPSPTAAGQVGRSSSVLSNTMSLPLDSVHYTV